MTTHLVCIGDNDGKFAYRLQRKRRVYILKIYERAFEKHISWERSLGGLVVATASHQDSQPVVGIGFHHPTAVLDFLVEPRLEVALMLRHAHHRALEDSNGLTSYIHLNEHFMHAATWLQRHGDKMYLAPKLKDRLWDLRRRYL